MDPSTENGIAIVRNIDEVSKQQMWTPSFTISGVKEVEMERNGEQIKVLNFTCSIRRPFKVPEKRKKNELPTEKPWWTKNHPILKLRTGQRIWMNVGYELTSIKNEKVHTRTLVSTDLPLDIVDSGSISRCTVTASIAVFLILLH